MLIIYSDSGLFIIKKSISINPVIRNFFSKIK